MNNFFCNHKIQKSDPEHTFSEIDINYRRDYSKGKSFKVSIWNEIDTYNNDDFIQDFVIYNQSLWARIDSTPSTNEVPTEGPWAKVMEGVSDVQFKEEGNKIFWKYEDESEWKDLFELDVVSESEIKNMLKDIATDVDSNFYDKTLSETSVNAVQNKVITQALNKKVDKVFGKDLSSNDFTNALKEKLERIENYDDSGIKKELSKKLEAEVVGTTTPTEGSIGGSYDDTEIRQEITELSERIDNLPTAESEVFETIYDTTTYEEIMAAHNEGKVVICKHNGYVLRLSQTYGDNIVFTASSGTTTAKIRCNSQNKYFYETSNAAHSLETLSDNKVKITIAGKTAEVATPQYISDAIASAITNVLNEEV